MPERAEVHRRPVLDQPALAHPEDVDELELDPISGRRQIPELTKVRPPKCLAPALGEGEKHRPEVERDVRARPSRPPNLAVLIGSDPPPIHVSRRDRHY